MARRRVQLPGYWEDGFRPKIQFTLLELTQVLESIEDELLLWTEKREGTRDKNWNDLTEEEHEIIRRCRTLDRVRTKLAKAHNGFASTEDVPEEWVAPRF